MVDGVRIRGQALVVLFVRGFKACYLPSPMDLAMAVMSAFGIFWHMLATVFMKLIYARQVFWLFPTSRGGLLNSGSES